MSESSDYLCAFIRAELTRSVYVKTVGNDIVHKPICWIVTQVRRQLLDAKMGNRPDLVLTNIRIIQVYSRLADIAVSMDDGMHLQFVLQIHADTGLLGKPWWLVAPNSNKIITDIIDLNNPLVGSTAFASWIASTASRKSSVQKALLEQTVKFYAQYN